MKKTTLIAGLLGAAVTFGAVSPVLAKDHRGGGDRVDFSTLDADGNGEVTVAEMDAQRLARFNEADTNGDGSLSAEEITAAAVARAGEKAAERAAKRVERMLERADENGNGTIEFSEMGDSERMAERFAKLDTDGSGGLTEDEMESARKDRGGKRKGGGRDR